ncbi:hypothetical protein BDN72DRAFT_858419 [Pluteus cervinus]|uniref:Uncharacterized protein n=1 Tax=Pluteus cervinus TaxID=181527 RepID=A0ACD3ARR8_9AGAR|nr:hypothetical protein BDN72DRAFT_858419 [Pluteus cervinus]
MHVSLDRHAFIAVTCCSKSLDKLIEHFEEENKEKQAQYDTSLYYYSRKIGFSGLLMSNAQYELVVLHPEHFLPKQSQLAIYHADSQMSKTYVVGPDCNLRESPGTLDNALLPPFSFDRRTSGDRLQLNPLLVVLNAEIKFRRYERMMPTPTPLPANLRELITRTNKPAELLFFIPINPMKPEVPYPFAPKPPTDIYEPSEDESKNNDGGEFGRLQNHAPHRKKRARRSRQRPIAPGMDYQLYLMSGCVRNFPPSRFAFYWHDGITSCWELKRREME